MGGWRWGFISDRVPAVIKNEIPATSRKAAKAGLHLSACYILHHSLMSLVLEGILKGKQR